MWGVWRKGWKSVGGECGEVCGEGVGKCIGVWGEVGCMEKCGGGGVCGKMWGSCGKVYWGAGEVA